MHNVDFQSDHKRYLSFKCCHVKYTDFSSILQLETFSSCFAQNCKNDIFVHFQDICSTNTIFMQKCRLKSTHKHYSIF